MSKLMKWRVADDLPIKDEAGEVVGHERGPEYELAMTDSDRRFLKVVAIVAFVVSTGIIAAVLAVVVV